jgi:hypothetical protein
MRIETRMTRIMRIYTDSIGDNLLHPCHPCSDSIFDIKN